MPLGENVTHCNTFLSNGVSNLLFLKVTSFWHANCRVTSILETECMMKKLTEALKQMLDALAYAHAGEYLTHREKTRVLSQKPGTPEIIAQVPEPKKANTSSHARRVALYLGSELPPEVMDYVIQTCARLRHKLTVLTFESESTGRALLQPHQEALAQQCSTT